MAGGMTMGFEWGGWHWRNGAGRGLVREAPAVALDLRHSLDLRDLLGSDQPRWTDALAQETRRQIADCLLAVEQSIVLHVSEEPFAALLGSQMAGFTQAGLTRSSALLSPALLRHMRQRGAIALIAGAGGRSGQTLPPQDDAVTELLSALTTAERGWQMQSADGPVGPARCDLPAEPFCDLAWTAAALIIDHIETALGGRSPRAVRAVAMACEAVIGRHDEGQGGFALAARVARVVDPGQHAAVARLALLDGRLLLFAALSGATSGLDMDNVIEHLLDGTMRDRFALLRLAEADDEAVVAFLGHVAPLNPASGRSDADIALAIDLYRAFNMADAKSWLARQTGPAPLALRLALLDRANS